MSNKDSSLSKVVLGILSLVNIILILGAGFAGESGVKIFGQSFPLKTSIIVLVLGILTNFFATLKDRKMLYLGGVILAAFVLLFTLISIG